MGATHTFGVSGWVCVKVTAQFKEILTFERSSCFSFQPSEGGIMSTQEGWKGQWESRDSQRNWVQRSGVILLKQLSRESHTEPEIL